MTGSPVCIENLRSLKPVDRNRVPLGGQLERRDAHVWFFPYMSEPFLVAQGDPLELVPEVLEEDGKLVFTRVELVP